ncbi:PREDICTED: transmembrane and TPR repeat-containing protein 1 [Nanorana parkeri]|uniref:transmembrane and TPR repeat-containing protein 1 n=1 Tax=Nanorana parkeri TaxID=125878 RepID=UPI0008542953|nr:PREDICTED: transmembrane and TPR repeat-containing protein 1 [Nanorana parkeri]
MSMRSGWQVIDNKVPPDTSNDVEQLAQRASMANGGNQSDIKQVANNPRSHKGSRNLQNSPTDLCTKNGQSVPTFIQKGHSNSGMMSVQRESPRNTSNGVGKSHCAGGIWDDGHKAGLRRPRNSPFPKVVDLGAWTFALPALAAGLCFAGSLFGEFVHDDIWAILNNPDSRAETNLSRVFRNDFWGKAMNDNTSHKSYRPLCVLSFRMNVYWWGLDPFYFHMVNVVLHCLVSSLLCYVCSRTVFEGRRPALGTALLFAVHPVHTEAVAGIVGRADVLACLLFLLAFLSYVRSVETDPATDHFPGTRSPLLLLLSLLLGTCAMLVKETGITVFGVCLVYDLQILCLRRLKRLQSLERHIKDLWAVAVPFLRRAALVSCHVMVVLAFRVHIMGGSMPLFSEQDNPASFSPYILTRFLTFSYLLAFNACLLLAPITLCYDWQVGSIPLVHSLWDRRNLETLVLLVVLLSLGLHCLAARKRTGHREVLVGLLFLVFPFIPASNVFFRVGFVVAERVLYMPSMGFCILCVYGMKVLHTRSGPRRSSVLILSFFLLLLLFSWKSVSQSECWRSRESLFRSGVQTLPHNAKVHYNYANFFKDQNRKQEAIDHYRTVLRLYPQHSSALNNLGTLTTNSTAAEEYYRKALAISPQHSRALFNLGNLLRTQGRNEEAELRLKESLLYGPYFADTYSSLGSLMADQKRQQEAEEVYVTGIKNCPDSSDLQNNYGVFLVDFGAPQKAVSHYLLALQLRPNHHVAMLNLGRLYRSLNQNSEAEKWYKMAYQISRDIDVITPLGALYYNTGKYDEALRLYKEAAELHPESVQIRLSLAQIQAVVSQSNEAETLALHIAADSPDCIECYRLLSAIYSKQEKYTKALEMIDVALQMKPKDPKIISDLYFTKGNQLRELNQLDKAFQSYSLVADLSPKQAQAWMNMGGIKHIQGDYIAARAYYEKASDLEPDSKLLKENFAKLERLESKIHRIKTQGSGGQQVIRESTEREEKTFSKAEGRTSESVIQEKEYSGTGPQRIKQRRTGQV